MDQNFAYRTITVFGRPFQAVPLSITNPTLQQLINELFQTDDVRFRFSYLAKTNNGVMALMDIKENNVLRLKELHGIITPNGLFFERHHAGDDPGGGVRRDVHAPAKVAPVGCDQEVAA